MSIAPSRQVWLALIALLAYALVACTEGPGTRASDARAMADSTSAPADVTPRPDSALTDAATADAPPIDAPSNALVKPYAACASDDPEVKLVAEVAPPATLQGGTTAAVSLTLANCGQVSWTKADPNAASGFKLGSQAPENNETWGVSRVALPATVPPGHSVLITFSIVAPQVSGSYAYRWAIVEEWKRWLADATPLHTITVNGTQPASFPYHPRGDWVLASQPISGPALDVMALRYITIHYNGGNADLDGPDNIYQDADFIPLLRNAQADYLKNRGYSLGYNSAIGPDGAEWEIRGTDYRSAANGCTAVNVPGYAIQVMMPSITAQPTATQIAGLKAAVARVRAFAQAKGNNDVLELNGHRDVRPLCGTGGTACPGDPIYTLLKAGQLEP